MTLRNALARFLPFAFCLLPCGLALANVWLGPGIINTHAGGDSPFLLIRVYELVANLRAGIFPARWMPDAAFGLGYPFFNFYASLPYYLAALLNLIGFDLLTAIELTQTLGMVAAAGSMWLLANALLPRRGAVLASVAYTLTPFHLVNLYVRGDSLSEFWAFVWFPLIVWFMLRDRGGALRLSSCVGLGLTLAGLVLTHNVSAVLFAPFVLIVAFVVVAASKPIRHSSFVICHLSLARRLSSIVIPLALAAVLALALSAWFWLPALGEAGSVQLNNQTTGYFNYTNHFRGLNLVQPNLLFDYTVSKDLNVFSMGLAQAVLVALGAGLWLWSLRKPKPSGTLADSLTQGLDEMATRFSRQSLIWVGALFLLSTFMLTPLSSFIWANAPLLALAQFPWRFLSVQAVFAALLIGGIGKGRLEIGDWRLRTLISNLQSLISIILLYVAALTLLPNERLNIRAEDVTQQTIQLYEWFGGNIGTTIRAEYLPKAVQPWPRIGFGLMGQAPRALPVGVGDDVAGERISATPHEQVWRVRVKSAGADGVNVVLPVLAAEGWRVEPSSIPLESNPGSGWLAFKLPVGEHEVRLVYEGTPLQRWGERVSLFALVVLLVALAWQRVGRANKPGFALQKALKKPGLFALGCIALFVALLLVAQISRWLQPALTPSLQAIDRDVRLFPHRGPVMLRAPDQTEYELIGAMVTPTHLIAGQPFSLSLQWKDDHAPAQITVTQESPNSSAYGYATGLFQFQRSIAPSNARISSQTTLREALPGPTLLKLSFGNWDESAVPTGTMILGPTITATLPNAPPQTLHTFGNGIRLHNADILQTSLHDFCFRPVWSRGATLQNPADALQISMRLMGADGEVLGRADWQPQGGLAPTWAWPNDVAIYDSACFVPFKRKPEQGETISVQVVWYYALNLKEVDSVVLRGVYLVDPSKPAVVGLEK